MSKTEFIFHEFIKWIIYFCILGLVPAFLAGPGMILVIVFFVFIGLIGGFSRAIYLSFSNAVTIEQISTGKLVIKRLVAIAFLISLSLIVIKMASYT